MEELVEEEEQVRKRHYHRRKKTKKRIIEEKVNYEEISGVIKKSLNAVSQKFLGLIVGEHVTSERPWKFISKEKLEDDIDLHEEATELLDIQEEIVNFPGTEMLIGYVPAEGTEIDEFYFCTTESAIKKVSEIINQLQEQRSERLQNTVEKVVGKWRTLGSDGEVQELMNKNNRPLIEVELQTKYPIISPTAHFKLRRVEDARDGYAEMICRRYTFNNITRKRVDNSIQSAPSIVDRSVQTVFTYPKNAWTQYGYEFDVPENDPRKMKKYADRLETRVLPQLEEDLLVNSTINFYKNDYKELVLNPTSYSPQKSRQYREVASLHDVFLSKNKVVSPVSWHPMWTGILAHSYSNIAINVTKRGSSSVDEVTRAVYDNNLVLFWSTKDTLKPKLLLESPQDVTYLSFCPFNENILIGGCANGQVIVWDITNKLQQVEEVEVLSFQQQNYRKIMRDMMDWMKFTKDAFRVRPVVASDVILSHTNAVTCIDWIQPQYTLTKMGHIEALNNDNYSLQFITSGIDGNIMFWDLLAKPTLVPGSVRPPRRLKRLKRRPSALVVDVSPFKVLNRIFKPFYKIKFQLNNDPRPIPITSFSYKNVRIFYKEKNPDPTRKNDLMDDRMYFLPELKISVESITKDIQIGSLEGDVAHVTWEGYKYSTGEIVTNEVGNTVNFAKYHDGPVVSLTQNAVLSDIFLTVGGKVFAIWKRGFNDQPIFWRRGKARFTSGTWMKAPKSNIRLVDELGYKEIWDIVLSSTHPVFRNRAYNVALLQSETFPFPFKTKLCAMTTGNAAVNIFSFNSGLDMMESPKKTKALKHYIEREIKRKTKFRAWQEKWKVTHPEIVNQLIEEEKERHNKYLQRQRQKSTAETKPEEATATEAEGNVKPEKEPRLTAEQLHEEWKKKEQERMTKILLGLKHLNPKQLQQQQIPLKKLEEEIARKNEKKMELRQHADEIFAKSVAMNFPEAIRPKTPPPIDPYAGGDMDNEELEQNCKKYEQISKDLSKFIESKPYTYKFAWSNLLDYGRTIRKFLDLKYESQSHRYRYEQDKRARRLEAEVLYLDKSSKKKKAQYITAQDDEEEELEEQESVIDFNAIIINEEEEQEIEDEAQEG